MNRYGSKIVVVGVSASGKSVFARKLAEKVALPLTHMDTIMWRPEWTYVGDEETDARIKEVSEGDEWLIEGYITKNSREQLFSAADTIIHLDYPRRVAAWRYLKRWWQHRKKPRPEIEGSPDRFSISFLSLVWQKKENISLKKFLRAVSDQTKVITLRTPQEAQTFLERL